MVAKQPNECAKHNILQFLCCILLASMCFVLSLDMNSEKVSLNSLRCRFYHMGFWLAVTTWAFGSLVLTLMEALLESPYDMDVKSMDDRNKESLLCDVQLREQKQELTEIEAKEEAKEEDLRRRKREHARALEKY